MYPDKEGIRRLTTSGFDGLVQGQRIFALAPEGRQWIEVVVRALKNRSVLLDIIDREWRATFADRERLLEVTRAEATDLAYNPAPGQVIDNYILDEHIVSCNGRQVLLVEKIVRNRRVMRVMGYVRGEPQERSVLYSGISFGQQSVSESALEVEGYAPPFEFEAIGLHEYKFQVEK